jgi:peptidyl-tRNA hydrolase
MVKGDKMEGTNEEYKLYVIVDEKLKMPKGKLSRVVAGAVTHVIMYHFSYFQWHRLANWYKYGFKTIVLKTDNFEKIIKDLQIFKQKHFVMRDAGITTFKKPTDTCVGLTLLKEKPFMLEKLKLL